MNQITTSKGTYLVEPTSPELVKCYIAGAKLYMEYPNGILVKNIGGGKLIGLVSDILKSEELAKEVVEEVPYYELPMHKDYVDALQVDNAYLSPINSFKSFVTAYSLQPNYLIIKQV